ncbi:LysR substrate-binding domain-containing protein [Pseudomonas sp. 21LCFQ02]|uniref:LysR substrate-binding domain-containing protein n=1 Tax=unclassified Pseudomonas TaxID=196821 RepID=UPI0004F6F67E|nr:MULTISPECIES: LysR substrate-binding domain-containing protein [unclassified Pseudomonas]MCO8163731.1 LysR substrate-binding domain-containing protein [Pseudomonas sp. 21LCFQ010]MCO8170330.1 LysR substrate-binding domain-containing protein [Pseudomonas sp. 21LCFQ02]BAP45423.1 LysR family transcriptional regulator [Pseudomonas sp. StFLB209]
MNPRRLTPSMSLLIAFEAAARHGSFTKAADELALTQSAVSRQVQALEAQLEVELFKRDGRRIELTTAGALYQHELAAALGRIRSATLQTIAHKSQSGTLSLAVLPTFGSRWLLPQMHDFYARHPGSVVHIHSRIASGDLSAASADMNALICVGNGSWPGYIAHPLMAEELLVIASPSALPDHAGMRPADVAQRSLLSVVSRPNAWSDWFEHHGLDHHIMRPGPSFEVTSHLIQAVAAGIGIALVPSVLVRDELARGELVSLFAPMDSGRRYYLAYPTRFQNLPALVVFRDWLLNSL